MRLICKTLSVALGIFLLLSLNASGQTMMSKLKYEEAEKAYQENNYQTTLQLIDEVEKMIKGTSPKTLYLKILAKNKISPVSFKVIQSLRSDCAYFLDKYDNIEDNEDRYREVYEISKTLIKYPKSEEEFQAINKRKEEFKQQEEALQKKVANYPVGEYGLKIGMEKADIPKKLWWDLKPNKHTPLDLDTGSPWKDGYYNISLKPNGRIRSIHTVIAYGKNIDEIGQKFETLAEAFTTYFGKSNVERKDSTIKSGVGPYGAGDIFRSVKLKNPTPNHIEVSLTIDKDELYKTKASLYIFAFETAAK